MRPTRQLGALLAGLWWNRRSPADSLKNALRRSPTAQFNRWPRHYDWMEMLLAGSKLERCRNAF